MREGLQKLVIRPTWGTNHRFGHWIETLFSKVVVEDSFVLDIKLNLSIHHLSKEICWLKYLHGNPAVKEVSF